MEKGQAGVTPISLVGFLSLNRTEDNNGYIGAALITDAKGFPLEFRCTIPVRPTGVQRALYGNLLEYCVAVELCGKPIIKAIQRRPGLLLASDKAFCDLYKEVQCPLVWIRRAGEVIQLGSEEAGERIEAPRGGFQPIIYHTHRDANYDRSYINGLLEGLFTNIDFLEPFERIKVYSSI